MLEYLKKTRKNGEDISKENEQTILRICS